MPYYTRFQKVNVQPSGAKAHGGCPPPLGQTAISPRRPVALTEGFPGAP